MMDLTGITLEDLHARTRDEDGHLIWTAYAAQGKYPQWRVNGVTYPARRIVWALAKGPIKPGHQIGAKCGHELCMSPGCLVQRTRKTIQKGMRLTAARKAKIAIGKRAHSKLDIETVRAIRASDLPGVEIERQHGLKQGYASRIRLGMVWRDHGNPFAGLGAR